MSTLTTANSALSLQITSLYPVPQSIQGYSTDDAFATDDVEPGEFMMGVDGKLSGGYVPYPTKLTITLQADSASNAIFDNWLAAQAAAKEVYFANGTIMLSGTGDTYVFTQGGLSSASPMPSAKKTLQPRKFVITFESCSKAPI
ncbi:MAG: hypothetical protein JWP38_3743 [Herbaspirillum sp.]|nr:hypothetical protein [Herbaspirillum sp.]